VLARFGNRPALHVSLIGRTRGQIAGSWRDVQAVGRKGLRRPITVSTHTNPRVGLEGAHYILNQIRVGGYPERAFDENFPREFGIPGEETSGRAG